MQNGQIYDVIDIFSGAARDFLVHNNGNKVDINNLKGKFIAIYFVPSMEREEPETTFTLAAAYRELHPKGDFDIVFVAGVVDDDDASRDDQELFNRCFSKMPWLAVPSSDKKSRELLMKLARDGRNSTCTILDPTGKVLSDSAIHPFELYGGQWYPFSEERVLQIRAEIYAALEDLSVNALLANPSRDFLITGKGQRVPISELEGKVIGLFFYTDRNDIDKKVEEIYKKVKERGENFEVVLIHPFFYDLDEKSFLEFFESMPWLSLPFMDPNWWRLRMMFETECTYLAKFLAIIEPNKKRHDMYGGQVMIKYGIEAYPFTRERPAEIEFERIKALRLESILTSDERNFLIDKTGTNVPFSELRGKTILLFIGDEFCSRCHRYLSKLLKWHKDIKSVDDEFEVLYVPWPPSKKFNKGDQKEYQYDFSKVPWLTLSCDEDYVESLYCKVLKMEAEPPMAAFGREGRLLSKLVTPKLDVGVDGAYPFTDDELYMEILVQTSHEGGNMWPIRGEDGKEAYIWPTH